VNDARRKALWQAMLEPFGEMRGLMEDKRPDEFVEHCRQILQLSNSLSAVTHAGLTTLSEGIRQVAEDYLIAKATPGLRGIPTGFPYFDYVTDGLQNANLYTVVARTEIGKTWKLLRMAKAAKDAGYSVLFLSAEMGVLQIARRFFGLETRINPNFIRSARLSTRVEREMQGQLASFEDYDGPPFFWLAGNFKKTVPALHIAANETQADIVFADASYLLKASDRTKWNARHELINDVMEGIHRIATEVDRPVVQSVQFNRQAVKPKRGENENGEEGRFNPVSHLDLTKIGGSDTIGQISAVVLGLTRGDPPHERDHRYAGLLKGREGEFGWYEYLYQFNPVCFDQIRTHLDVRDHVGDEPAPDISHMDDEA
jgi:replicative DNA helicase